MSEKLSDRLWRILNDATLGEVLSVPQLCAIDEARALAKRVEDAPRAAIRRCIDSEYGDTGKVNCNDLPGEWIGKRVRLVVEGEP